MGKMDEQIIVVNKQEFFEGGNLLFQGVMTDPSSIKFMMKNFRDHFVVRRGHAEENLNWKQPIPYTILKRGNEIFAYKRLAGGGETRLYEQISIGVGGHMNRLDDRSDWRGTLLENIERELFEELYFGEHNEDFPPPTIIGLINDDFDPLEVGKYHIGILNIIELHETMEVSVKETEALDGVWMTVEELRDPNLNLESWSRLALENLEAL